MKIILSILILSLHVNAFELIDSNSFQALSQEQQVRYLTEVQKIVVGITKKSSYSAENESDRSRSPANVKPDLSNWSRKPKTATSPSPQVVPQETSPTYFNPELNRNIPQPPLEKQAAKTETKKPETKKPVVTDSEPQKTKTEPTHFRCMHSGFVIEEDPCTGFQKIPNWMGIDGITEKNKSCAPGLSVCNPILFGLDLSDNCNSLLEGECSKTAKPFCAKRGLWPTEECHQMATANGNRGTWIAAEISSQIKPSLYEKYQQQMKGLCDPEKIKTNPFAEFKNGQKRSDKTAQAVRDDLTKTCEWASKQVAILNETIVDQTQDKSYSAPKKAKDQK